MSNKVMYALPLAALIAIYSCSVKEDRSACPCIFTVDAGGIAADEVTAICRDRNGNDHMRILHPAEGETKTEVKVPRGVVKVMAYSGNSVSVEKEDSIIIPFGHGADCLYADVAYADARGETAYEKISLYKQFTVINLKIDCAASDWRIEDCVLHVSSRTHGLSLLDLRPVAGGFSCTVHPDNNGIFSFRLPRQNDDESYCWLECDGKRSDSIALGHILREHSFDWSKRNLDDISLEVGLPSDVLSVTIVEWDKESIDVEI